MGLAVPLLFRRTCQRCTSRSTWACRAVLGQFHHNIGNANCAQFLHSAGPARNPDTGTSQLFTVCNKNTKCPSGFAALSIGAMSSCIFVCERPVIRERLSERIGRPEDELERG